MLAEAARGLPTAEGQALPHLVWLARANGSEAAIKAVVAAAGHNRADVRLQAVRALAEAPRPKEAWAVLMKALHDASPAVKLAALAAFADPGEAPKLEPVGEIAMGSDTYLRQAASRVIARYEDADSLRDWMGVPLSKVRLAAVLAAGTKLTVPPADEEPPAEVPLFFPADDGFFHAKAVYADSEAPVDVRSLGRVGSYTTAQRWKAVAPFGQGFGHF